MFSSTYTLRKSQRILDQAWTLYRKKKDRLTPHQLTEFEDLIRSLKESIDKKDRDTADRHAHDLAEFCDDHFPKPWWKSFIEIAAALAMALIIATIIRQTWFELYEIPTGSMRPTFREQDHLTVSKTAFGINVPLQTAHFYFDPNHVQRTSAIIFSGDGLPVIDTDSTFFGLFPYKKRFVKRMIGKPGDTLYFYGGKIYGFDKDGNFISELIDSPWMANLEHIPFINFDGVATLPKSNVVQFDQMHIPLARLQLSRSENPTGEILSNNTWVADNPSSALKTHEHPVTYSDFWGIGNFAMARLVKKDQLKELGLEAPAGSSTDYYLELRHHPSVTFPKPLFYTSGNMTGITLNSQKSVLPVSPAQMDALRKNLYTARFVVKDGQAIRYSVDEPSYSQFNAKLSGVPDGTYEFYFGKGYKVGFGGILQELPANHPLYNSDPAFIQRLYNLGVNWDPAVEPQQKHLKGYPTRFAYFRDGDLYLLGAKIYGKDEPLLKAFVANENDKATKSTQDKPYLPFVDQGPPMKNGQLDKDFIQNFGLKVPDRHYLVLGDNHAMSGDSRIFGFVPEANLQGAPSIIIWPPGDRLGVPAQKPYEIFVLPRLIIWILAALVGGIWYYIYRRNNKITLPPRNKS